MNLANLQGLQGAVTGTATDSPRAPMSDFRAEMMAAPLQTQGLVSAAAVAHQAACAAAAAAERAASGNSAAEGSG